MDYYTALLNAVDCSIHLHGPSQRSAVNYFCLRSLAWALLNFAVNARYKLTAVKENKGLFAYNDVFGVAPQVVR